MSPKPLSSLVNNIAVLDRRGSGNPLVSDLAYDSRAVVPGSLFFAFDGTRNDGHRFIDDAFSRGAAAVVQSQPLPLDAGDRVLVRVAETRLAFSAMASAFYEHPGRSLVMIGVTGTEGKSTTVLLIGQLLELCRIPAGYLSTVLSRTGERAETNQEHQTTPEATTIQRALAAMRDFGLSHAVVEASSHGLSLKTARLADVPFDVGVLTNVTHEHLEFHGTWERYRDDKANLFRSLGRDPARGTSPFGVVNEDDPSASYFRGAASVPVYGYSANGQGCALWAEQVRTDERGSSFVLRDGAGAWPVRLNLAGAFNIDNALAAALAVQRLTGREFGALAPLLASLQPVPGRMAEIVRGQPFRVIVDYAHTPHSFESVLGAARKITRGRLIAVFGSAGERDVAKRPLQGRIAGRFCDLVILTDEDPRGEAPLVILDQIARGVREEGARTVDLELVPDRVQAIRRALSAARAGDLVLLLGKGHEKTIIYERATIPWNEGEVATEALAELGYADPDASKRASHS